MRIVFVLFIAFTSIFSVWFGENTAKKKKKRSFPFSSSKPRAKKKSKSEFDKEWAAKLAESDKGSFYRQEKWLEELLEEFRKAKMLQWLRVQAAPKFSLKNQKKKAN